jgi:hypothetical protein
MFHIPCSEFGPEVITDQGKFQMPASRTNLRQMRGGGKGLWLGMGLVRFANAVGLKRMLKSRPAEQKAKADNDNGNRREASLRQSGGVFGAALIGVAALTTLRAGWSVASCA